MPLALQTLTAPVIDTRLAALEARMSHFLPPDLDEVRALLADADRLARSDALEASHLRGRIHTLTGEPQQVDYWFANARRLRDDWRAAFNHASCLASLGYFSDAAALTSRFLNIDTGKLTPTVNLAVKLLDLQGAASAHRRLAQVGLRPLGADPSLIDTAGKALAACGESVEQARLVLDVAGEILRERRLWWRDRTARLIAESQCDDHGILYEMGIAVSVDEGCALTDEHIDRMLERGLGLCSFSFSFIGLDEMPPITAPRSHLKQVQ